MKSGVMLDDCVDTQCCNFALMALCDHRFDSGYVGSAWKLVRCSASSRHLEKESKNGFPKTLDW